jgi:hypothetical protein
MKNDRNQAAFKLTTLDELNIASIRSPSFSHAARFSSA